MLEDFDPRVRRILENLVCERLAVKPDQLRMDTNLIQDLGADSLDMVDLALDLEQELQIRISEEEVANMTTVGDALRYLSARLEAAASDAATPDGERGPAA
jgi:acyl carrier protein